MRVRPRRAYLNSLFSSMTWIPWSYCSGVAFSPTPAKWPFMTTEGDECMLFMPGRGVLLSEPLGTCRAGDAIATDAGRG